MNYVGCKVLQGIITNIEILSFYMNYVGCKVFQRFRKKPSVNCFIWTMWDVKNEIETLKKKILKLFYMNYVGCKGIWWADIGVGRTSFIWTMWDVKV